jgi:isoleucyl-tRNA synthetase
MAPFLSFTAEEAWKFAGDSESIFLETFSPMDAPDAALLDKWSRIREIRDFVNKEIETVRAEGKLGSSLQAEVDFGAAPADYQVLASLENELKFLFITSVARVQAGERAVKVTPSANAKCDRCWHYTPDVDAQGLCGRCRSNLNGPGEDRHFV